MHGERLPKLFSSLQGGGKKNLPCMRKKHPTRWLFGFATFQQNAREKACYDCRLQSMSAQRSQVIHADFFEGDILCYNDEYIPSY